MVVLIGMFEIDRIVVIQVAFGGVVLWLMQLFFVLSFLVLLLIENVFWFQLLHFRQSHSAVTYGKVFPIGSDTWFVTGLSWAVGGYPKKIWVWGSNEENSSVINEKAIKCYKML